MIILRSAPGGQLIPREKLFNITDPNIRIYTIDDSIDPGFEFVFWNGYHMIPVRDYAFDGTNFTIDTEILLVAGDDIYVKYFL